MTRRFVAEPGEAITGRIDDGEGPLPEIITIFGEIYEPSDVPSKWAKTLAAWKAGRWDPATSSLRLPVGNTTFTIGPEVLAGLDDETLIRIQIKIQPLRGGGSEGAAWGRG